MKPIVIIAIAVVCSVVAMFGVLVGYEMYQAYQLEKGLAFGVDVSELYENNLLQITHCIPNDKQCYDQTVQNFDNDFNILADKNGINLDNNAYTEYRAVVHSLLDNEYEYQNQVYQIELESIYLTSELYGTGSPQLDRIVNSWQIAYQNAIRQTSENKENIFQDSNMQDEMDSCPEGLSWVDCLGFVRQTETSSKMPAKSRPYCIDPDYTLDKYTISDSNYHESDKNQNGLYCVSPPISTSPFNSNVRMNYVDEVWS